MVFELKTVATSFFRTFSGVQPPTPPNLEAWDVQLRKRYGPILNPIMSQNGLDPSDMQHVNFVTLLAEVSSDLTPQARLTRACRYFRILVASTTPVPLAAKESLKEMLPDHVDVFSVDDQEATQPAVVGVAAMTKSTRKSRARRRA